MVDGAQSYMEKCLSAAMCCRRDGLSRVAWCRCMPWKCGCRIRGSIPRITGCARHTMSRRGAAPEAHNLAHAAHRLSSLELFHSIVFN